MPELRRITMYRATSRSMLFMGGERGLVIMTIVVSGALVFTGMTWTSFLIGALLFFFGLYALRKMAIVDPELSTIFKRWYFTLNQKRYLARGNPHGRNYLSPK